MNLNTTITAKAKKWLTRDRKHQRYTTNPLTFLNFKALKIEENIFRLEPTYSTNKTPVGVKTDQIRNLEKESGIRVTSARQAGRREALLHYREFFPRNPSDCERIYMSKDAHVKEVEVVVVDAEGKKGARATWVKINTLHSTESRGRRSRLSSFRVGAPSAWYWIIHWVFTIWEFMEPTRAYGVGEHAKLTSVDIVFSLLFSRKREKYKLLLPFFSSLGEPFTCGRGHQQFFPPSIWRDYFKSGFTVMRFAFCSLFYCKWGGNEVIKWGTD